MLQHHELYSYSIQHELYSYSNIDKCDGGLIRCFQTQPSFARSLNLRKTARSCNIKSPGLASYKIRLHYGRKLQTCTGLNARRETTRKMFTILRYFAKLYLRRACTLSPNNKRSNEFNHSGPFIVIRVFRLYYTNSARRQPLRKKRFHHPSPYTQSFQASPISFNQLLIDLQLLILSSTFYASYKMLLNVFPTCPLFLCTIQ